MHHLQIRLPRGTTVRDRLGKRYVIEGLLGQGQSGAVYLVREQRTPHRLFALKEVITPNKEDRERFLFEGEVLTRLKHRALPRVYQMFEHDQLQRMYILMDYIQGKNLETLRQEQAGQRFSLSLALALMKPVVEALSYLHQQDVPIVHRDIKPANIIVPAGTAAMLVDFGSAKEYHPDAQTVTVKHRTSGYAALEQYSAGAIPTTPQTDIYALGATFYTLLTGKIPLNALKRVTRTGSPARDLLRPADLISSDIPQAVAQTLGCAMALERDERFQTVEVFWLALTASAPEPQVPLSRETSVDPPRSQIEQGIARKGTPSLQKQDSAPQAFPRGAFLPILLSLLAIVALAIAFFSHVPNLPLLLLLGLGAVLLSLLLWRSRW
ncbi:MAG TPA: serine/threonine-protein kinase [Ktedonosporobacter sp.]|nr:serine/threonine-protein kinase [Ktedonosporobacter sp.]